MSEAANIARALGGKTASDGYLCHCPVAGHGKGHGDRKRSLLVKDGEVAPLFKCFAGCDVRDVLAALRHRGLIEDDAGRRRPESPAPFVPPTVHEPDPEALKIWRGGNRCGDSIAETYLRSRGIVLALPPSLRCGTRLHLDRYSMPVLIAAVQRSDGNIVAVQTTLLTPSGKKAPVAQPRMTTGALGAGAVRFAGATEVLGLAEGVETGLSAMQLTGAPCWACLGAGRMHRVAIPDNVRELHIFCDSDEPGRMAAERTAHANRHRRVVLRYPPAGCKDWNDAVALRAVA